MTAEADSQLAPLSRDLDAAEQDHYDVIVVGGGIHGVCLLYEASRRGLRGLLVERGDFGGETSWNSMRILHGGFRYLQSLDIRRYIESVRSRRWFMRMFPGLVEPLDCIMPLYGDGVKRPDAFRVAVAMNRRLIGFEGREMGEPKLSPGAVLSASDVAQEWQQVPTVGLRGGGAWTDARMLSPERMLIHLLRVAVGRGCRALNYVSAEGLVTSDGSVRGIVAQDVETGRVLRLSADLVINAAGPSCKALAQQFGDARPDLFIPMRAFNLVVNRPPVSDSALAVSVRRPGAQTYFVVPWGDRVVVGTPQLPCEVNDFRSIPTLAEVTGFLEELNEAVPGLGAAIGDVSCVWSGLVPAPYAEATVASDRAQIVEHGRHGGPDGLISVSGVKFTTAPKLARRVFERIPGPPMAPFPDAPCWTGLQDIPGYSESMEPLGDIARDECVRHADDLVFRRTGLWQDRRGAMAAWPAIAEALELQGPGEAEERSRLERALARMASPWDSKEEMA